MFEKIVNWFRKSNPAPSHHRHAAYQVPKTSLSTAAMSTPFPQESLSLFNPDYQYLPPPGADPRVLFPILRRLRDYIPDVSAGVWAWVRLCSTPQSYTFTGGSPAEQTEAAQILADLDKRICGYQPGREHGVEALVQAYFLSVFTYGSFCGEVILHDSRRKIERFVVIDPASIRFRLDPKNRIYTPYQIQHDNTLIPLGPSSFFYYGLDTDGLSPYGRSPLLAIPLMVKLQQQLLHDMTRAQHNAGYPTVHFKVSPVKQMSGEHGNDYNQRLNHERDDSE